MKGTTLYTEIPNVPGTPQSRIAALKESRELLKEEPSTTKASMFGGETLNPGSVGSATELIRLATYIETGHDYKDTHPQGKRRPIIKQTTNVTVVDPSGMVPGDEDLAHFLHHVENGDFTEFLKDAMNGVREPEPAEDEESAADEPEHRPVDPEDRPRFS